MRLLPALLTFVSFAAPTLAADATTTPPAAPERNWTLQFDQDLRVVSWRSTRGYPAAFAAGTPGRGSQIYMPVSLNFGWTPTSDIKLDLLVRSGWAVGQQRSGGGLRGTVGALTDTSITPTITYTGWENFQPFVSLAVNAPTGRANLKGRQSFARMDPDLVEIANYGAGLAIGPTVGFSYSFNPETAFTFSVGHTFMQPYWRDSVLGPPGVPLSRMNPANSTTYNAQISHKVGAWNFSLAGLLTTSGKSSVDGVFESRSGYSFTVMGNAGYAWSEAHNTNLAVSLGFSRRNYILDPALGLIQEPANRNNRTFRIGAEHLWAVTSTWTLGASASIFVRDKNSYDPTNVQFVPAKTKIAMGMSARYKWSEAVSLNARVEHFWLRETSKPDIVFPGPVVIPGSAIPRLRSTGLLMSVGSSVTF